MQISADFMTNWQEKCSKRTAYLIPIKVGSKQIAILQKKAYNQNVKKIQIDANDATRRELHNCV